jgi:hypothetical protein
MLQLVRRADPCFVISVIGLIIVVPIGFTIDHVRLHRHCSASPVLYLNPNRTDDLVPLPFVWFVQSARREIQLVLSSSNDTRGDLIAGYYRLLLGATGRGVSVHVVTNDAAIASNFTFCATMTLARAPGAMFVFLAQADGARGFYASGPVTGYVCAELQYVVDFADCASVAADIASLFSLLRTYAVSGYPELFSHALLPGSSFPAVHALPGGGRCEFAVAPQPLTPPGRAYVVDVVDRYFREFGPSLSVLTEALFPRPEMVRDNMPELLIVERIAIAALAGTGVRVLIPQAEWIRSRDQLRSLAQFPNIEIRPVAHECTLPTLYTFQNQAGFMPMPFELLVKSDAVTVALRLIDDAFAAKLKDHFDALWASAAVTDL